MEKSVETKKRITKDEMVRSAEALLISGFLGIIGNWVGYEHVMPLESLPGMCLLLVVCIIGILLSKFIGKSFPSFIHVSVVGILVTMPWNPISSWAVGYVNKIQLMAVVTPILAYSGLTIGHDWRAFRKLGWKAIVVGCLVIFGTFFWSALIAEVLMKVQGTI